MSAPSRRARSWMARLLPYLLVVTALPLLAPTCGGQQPGPKVFAKGSLIIPMDACYQNTPTTLTNATYFTPYAGCPSNGATASDHGNVLKAYGLVYQLLRNNIPVYWVINSQKSPPGGAQPLVDTARPDATVSYATGGAVGPVGKYVWANDTVGAMPPNVPAGTTSVGYHGGPFVVDGSDAAAARLVMQSLKATFGAATASGTNPAMNVHVSNVAFSAEVARSMSGNFSSSGGATPPPIALLNITGGDGKNSEVVIQGYLVDAGLGPADFAGAGGTATPTGHGKIYDDLLPADFLPSSCTTSCANGSACTAGQCASNLVAYGYSILWVPHWCGPGSANVPAGFTYLDILASIRAFMNAGHDVMAECASLGTFEGVNNATICSSSPGAYDNGTHGQQTQIQTTTGVNINDSALAGGKFLPPMTGQTTFATPFLQIGDFPYNPVSGAIQQFYASNAYVTRPTGFELKRLIADSTATGKDYFTWLPAYSGVGNVVYLAGHDFSGGQGAATQIGGSRLVLNTLFNLGNACKATHAACVAQQALGACRNGTQECCTAADVTAGYCLEAGDPFCKPGTPQPETCNGLDDDCDGIVDNHLTDAQATTATGCYPGATAGCTAGAPGVYTCQGVCHPGTWSCTGGAWSCVGAGTPGTEICNGLDDDCNGIVDDNLTPPGGSPSCYTGPTFTGAPVPGTSTGCQVSGGAVVSCQGECRAGTWACNAGAWGCTGQVLPAQERCEAVAKDYNCNGIAGDGCDCVVGSTQPCAFPSYPGYSVTPGIGICRTGAQTCVNSGGRGVWGACAGQVLPNLVAGVPTEICGNGLDDDCNGIVDDPAKCDCLPGQTQPCYPAGAAGCVPKSGTCAAGTVEKDGMCCTGVCAPGVRLCVGGKFASACTSAVTPAPAEKCNGKNDTCSGGWTGDDTAPCPTGYSCVNGACIIATIQTEGQCACGYQRIGASVPYTCVAPNCPSAPCPAGTLCLSPDPRGAGYPPICPAPGTTGTICVDPCAGKVCGEGAYCSGGACVGGGCTATGCIGADAGKVCRNGTCQADPCTGVTCPAGSFARGNFGQSPPACDCVRPCATVVCPQGQACDANGFCAPDPCTSVSCPAGKACVNGACADDPCPPGKCGQNQICTAGLCTDDPCVGAGAVVCPPGVGTCIRGQCQDAANPLGYGPPPPATATTKKSGCGCGGGEAGTGSLLLALLGLPLARRRRPGPGASRGAALAGLALLLALGGAACGKNTKEKPNCETCGGDTCVDLRTSASNCGACGHGCGAGQVCGTGTCIAAAPVPAITGAAPSPVSGLATVQVTGTGFVSGATLRVSDAVQQAEIAATVSSPTQLQAPVDLSAVGQGTLRLQVVNPDRGNSNVWPVPVGTPTPLISGVTPGTGTAGTVVPVVVAGSNFTSNAVCVQRAGGVETVIVPSARTVPSSLSCSLDLSAVPPGFVDLYVQNENNVRSAAASPRFQAVSPASAPIVTSVAPTKVPAGGQVYLLVTGQYFEPSSTVELAPITAPITWAPLPTTFVYSTSVRAALSLASVAAGTYQVHVVNAPGGTSGAATFEVTPTAPVASNLALTPATPVLGQTGVQVALSGSGFAAGCTVQIQRPDAAQRAASAPAVTASLITATVDLNAAGDAAGTWYAWAVCPNGTTAALPFAVASNQASLVSVSPAGGGQGDTVPVALTGSNFLSFAPGMTVTLDGGTPVAAAVTSSTAATATLQLAGVTTGVHLLRAVNAGALPSNPVAFSVTPGTPAISAIAVADAAGNGACTPSSNCSSCASASACLGAGACAFQQPKNVQVTVSGANFGAGVSTVYVTSALTGKVDLSTVPGIGTVAVVDASTIRMTLDTTAVFPQTYTLTVENPGKPASNPTAFKVTAAGCP